ncbi:MAG: class I SAM-dependent methyltransferase [Deltaproteobacteria bacterium]|nr:class I SAM-dependent methyltransferase [Deltaproteobacteria bacterium]
MDITHVGGPDGQIRPTLTALFAPGAWPSHGNPDFLKNRSSRDVMSSSLNDFTPLEDVGGYLDILARLDIGFEIEWNPEHVVNSTWHENIPLAFWMAKILRPSVFVELGTENGASYMPFCQVIKRFGAPTKCHAIDLWKPLNKGDNSHQYKFDLVNGHSELHYQGFSTIHRASFDDCVDMFDAGEIELLHIDGRHSYEETRHNFDAWADKLSREKGIVIVHDINVVWESENFGVYRFWDGMRGKYPSFTFAVGAGLGVLGVGNGLPGQLQYLLSSDNETKLKIQTIFGNRGLNVRRFAEIMLQGKSLSWKMTQKWKPLAKKPRIFRMNSFLRKIFRGYR